MQHSDWKWNVKCSLAQKKKKKNSQTRLRWSAGLPETSLNQLKQAKTILYQIRPNTLGWFKQVFEAVLF